MRREIEAFLGQCERDSLRTVREEEVMEVKCLHRADFGVLSFPNRPSNILQNRDPSDFSAKRDTKHPLLRGKEPGRLESFGNDPKKA